MPEVNGKHFSYSPAGRRAAARARRKLTSKKSYSSDAIKMARNIYG